MAEDLGLVEEFWLLTTGTQEVTSPPKAVVIGTAMCVLTDLLQRREVRWRGTGVDLALDTVADCRCEGRMRQWHGSLEAAAAGRPIPARFALDPLVSTAWSVTAADLVTAGWARRFPHRFGRASFAVADPGWVRARRADLVRLLPTDGGVRDLPLRERTVLTVATASDAETALLGVHGLDLPPAQQDAITRSAQGDPLLDRLEATAAYRNSPLPTWPL